MATGLAADSTVAATDNATRVSLWQRGEITSQLLVCGVPLLVGLLFPIGKPVYSTLFGEIGKYNCLSYLLFHRPCPACGLTSGVVSTLHGQLDLSLAYHPLGWAFTLLFAFGFVGGLLRLRRMVREVAPPRAVEAWLLDFPSADLMRWLAFGFLAVVAGRLIFWLGELVN